MQVAFLDRYHPNICETIRRGLPGDWAPKFAESRELKDQMAAVAEADLLFVMAAPVTPEILAAAKKVRFIQKLGAGVDRIDLKVCEDRGIGVARLAGGNAIPVAEHALLLILATLRRLPLDRPADTRGGMAEGRVARRKPATPRQARGAGRTWGDRQGTGKAAQRDLRPRSSITTRFLRQRKSSRSWACGAFPG